MSGSVRFVGSALRTTLAVTAAIIALAAIVQQRYVLSFLSESFGVGRYESVNQAPVSFTVITRDGASHRFAIPRIYLVERIGEGDTIETAIGDTAFVLALDTSGARPCRGTEDCTSDTGISAAFPYPYEIADGAPPATARDTRPSDVDGFALTVTSGAVPGDPDAAVRTETRRYRAGGAALAPRMDCNMAIAGNVEGGMCHVAVRWRGEAYIDVAMAARHRAQVHEIARDVAALFDSFEIAPAA